MNFIVLIAKILCYELIVFHCKVITLWIDYIDCIMTVIIFKLTVLSRLQHTMFTV